MEDDRRPDDAGLPPDSPDAEPPPHPPEADGPVPPDPAATASDSTPSSTEPEWTAATPEPVVGWASPATEPQSGPAGPAPLVGWAPVSEAPPRIQVRALFARTLDTFIANWPTFVVLGIPISVIAVLTQLLAFDLRTPTNAATGTLLVLLVGIPVNVAALLAMVVAADDVRAGRPVSIGSSLRRGVVRMPIAILSALVLVLAYLGMAIVLGLGLVLLALVPRVGPVLAGIFGIVGFCVIVYVLLRYSLFAAPVALDDAGPIRALGLSWHRVKGQMWRLGLLFVALYLLFLPLTIGGSFLILAASANAIVGGVVGILIFLVIGPLFPIALSLAWGDLTDRPRVDQPTRPAPRRLFAGAILVGGLLLLVPSVALGLPRLGELALAAVPPEDRGTIYFGTDLNPTNPCKPLGRTTSFFASDSIYIGGYFSRTLAPGQSAAIHAYLDGQEVLNSPISAGAQAVACYYEPEPLVGAPVGSYRIVIQDDTGTLAEGRFTVR